MISEVGSAIGGFRTILKLHDSFRGRQTCPRPDHQKALCAPTRRRSLRVPCVVVALCAFGAMLLLTGCQDYNPNLGAAASFSSQISLIVPSSRNAGCTGSFTLDVQGAGFVDGSTVQWNGQNLATTFETASEMLATVPQSNLAMQNTAPVTIPITVSVPGQIQGNDQSNSVTFTVNPPLPPNSGTCPKSLTFSPNITNGGLSPASGAVGATVTITGTYFGGDQGTSTVTFAGPSGTTVPATITSTSNWSATSITTTVPTGAVSGPVIVTVGGLASNSNVIFTVVSGHDAQAPTASSVSASALYAGVSNPVSASTGARYVAFVATSADPSIAGNAGVQQVFLRDTCFRAAGSCTPQTILVSAGLGGAQPNGASRAPAISADGRFVAFASDATNLVPHDDNRVTDIFLRDTCLGVSSGCLPTTIRISLGFAELEANGASSSPSISADGRYVAFNSVATNLTLDAAVAPGANSVTTFLRDTCLGVAGPCTPSSTLQATSTAPAQ